jgi:hypothetical protein
MCRGFECWFHSSPVVGEIRFTNIVSMERKMLGPHYEVKDMSYIPGLYKHILVLNMGKCDFAASFRLYYV